MTSVALVGTPNSGKTTLFNWLTGSRQKVVNYPGSTVDYSLGVSLPVYGDRFQVYDTPGTYSLFAKNPEEEVTVKALFNEKLGLRTVVAVIDSSQLSRQLHIIEQLRQAGFSVVVALTMYDLYVKENTPLDVKKLEAELGVPVYPIDGVLGGGVKELAAAIRAMKVPAEPPKMLSHWTEEERRRIFERASKIASNVQNRKLQVFTKTEQLDKILMHPFWGLLIFAAIMTGLFTAIYWAAAPFMDMIDAGFSALADWTKETVTVPLLADFLGDGILASFGAVLVFVPQIFILFLVVSFLEDSGYLARAATLIDRPLSRLGMNGKSFVPLLSGFACAIPAMMSARAINSKKARWITIFIIPLMTCSARLPVYALLLSFLFVGEPAWKPGLTLAALYLGGLTVGLVLAAIINKFLKVKENAFFLLELPIYRRPKGSVVLRNSLKRTKAYLQRSGPVIFVFAMLIWVASTFPRYDMQDPYERLSHSFAAQAGQVIEPVFEPMGVDWRVGVSLLSAFAAREVFVSSLAVMMNITEGDEDSISESLLEKMKTATNAAGEPIFTVASVLGLLVFFMIALQCTTTMSVAWREMKSGRFALQQLIVLNLLAYGLAVLIYQTVKAIWY